MVTYTVHEQPEPAADRADRAEALEFVQDGFSWVTAAFPPLGFARERLWVELAIYLAIVSVGALALKAVGLGPAWTSLLATALNVYLGFELSSLKRWSLERRGWTTVGSVSGRDLAECERRFFESWLPTQPPVVAARSAEAGASGRSAKPFGGIWPFAAHR